MGVFDKLRDQKDEDPDIVLGSEAAGQDMAQITYSLTVGEIIGRVAVLRQNQDAAHKKWMEDQDNDMYCRDYQLATANLNAFLNKSVCFAAHVYPQPRCGGDSQC